jgi:integral membrane protein
MLRLFRLASLAEGISLLVILSVALGLISRDHVYVLGMTHGILFLIYCALSLVVSHKQGWSVVTWVLILAAGTVPFAFVLVERFLEKETQKAATSAS